MFYVTHAVHVFMISTLSKLGPSSGAQEFYRWLLPVVLGALVYRSLVWCGAVGYVSGLRDVSRNIPQTGHKTNDL